MLSTTFGFGVGGGTTTLMVGKHFAGSAGAGVVERGV